MTESIKGALLRRWTTAAIALKSRARDAASTTLEGLGTAAFGLRPAHRRRLQERDRQAPRPDGTCLTEREARLVSLLAAWIVPSSGDEEPGADDIDVLGPSATSRIDAWLAPQPAKQVLYTRGLIALDEIARRRHGTGLAEVSPSDRDALLSEVGERHRARGGAASLWRKLTRKARHLHGMWQGWSAAVELFPAIVADTQRAFYTSEVAWMWLRYDGPPMPLGYPSLAQARPAKKVPALAPASVAVPAVSVRRPSADVVVVGCGAGGAVAAKELAEAGLSVVVLEAGRRFTPLADYVTDRQDFELYAKDMFDAKDPRRDLYTAGGSAGFSYNRVKGVGGSTLHYTAMNPRLHESDFRVRTEDGVADDWPIAYADLEPYYTRVEYELGVSGPDGANPFEPPRSRPYPNPAHPFNLASLAIKRGADRLGLHMVREPLALPSRDWQGRPACVGAGTCRMGCLISAKSSMDVTYVPKAEATGRVDIRPESMACEIELDATGRAIAVVYIDADGRHQRVGAKAVVVAGNAVETARLLLMSTSNRFPLGLANSSGLVGRNFMEHVAVFTFGSFEERVDPWRGTPTGGMIQDDYASRAGRGFARGWTTVVSHNSHWPLAVAQRLPGWGQAHKQRMLETFGHFACVATIGEQLPDPRNRVTLDPVQKDIYGLPVPRIVNEPRDNDAAMIRAMSASLKTLLEAAGSTGVWGTEYIPGGSSHYMGTCRMGADPSRSVVNASCATHDVPNLFIADGSVFVTSGAVNPALTISALSLRTSEGIVRAFKRGEL